MKNPSLHRSRTLATYVVLSLGGVSAYATGCGGSTENGDDKGSDAGDAGDSGKGGTGAGGAGAVGGTAGSSGKGGASTGGSATGGSGAVAGDAGAGGADTGGSGGQPSGGQGGEGGAVAVDGVTCKAILDDEPASATGVYVIDPDGNAGAAPYSIVCDMTTGGGGWSLGLVVNSVADGHYQTFGSANFNVAVLATTPEAASGATATAKAGWANLNAFPYTDLRLTGYTSGAQVYTSNAIAKSSLRLEFGHNGYYLYDQGGYFWCGGTNAYTTDAVGQENTPTGAPADCKGHTSLGDGWDFGPAAANQGLTVCGGGSRLMTSSPTSGFTAYPGPGKAQAIWVR